jgi:hypothetical protein
VIFLKSSTISGLFQAPPKLILQRSLRFEDQEPSPVSILPSSTRSYEIPFESTNGTETTANNQTKFVAGLLYDENGNRFTPSHATKQGQCYRYYVQGCEK